MFRLLTASAGSFYNESYNYDSIGRITQVSKVIDSNTYNLGYAYNNANQVTSITYPSGRAITQGFDGVGRLGQILTAGSPPYITIASTDYNAAGQVKHVLYGNAVAGDLTYKDHLQLATLRYSKPSSPDLLNLGYDYTTATVTGNNGQIQMVHYYTAPGTEDLTKTQNYEYDAWLRIKKAYTSDLTAQGTWQLQWDYDRFGNRKNQTMSGGVCSSPPPGYSCPTQPQLGISELTNRITDTGFAYDAAGNLTNDAIHTYAYDAENRIKTVDSTAATYTYDASTLRIKRTTGGITTVYIFSGSKVIAEYTNGSLSKEYVYAGSNLLATVAASGATTYQYPDHLSTRVEADSNGAVTRNFAHYPFGESWYETGTASKWKLTSYERDDESQLDNAIFRSYSSRLGRFMQADRLGGSARNPQSMNRYTYARNDPMSLADPLGLMIVNLCYPTTHFQPAWNEEGFRGYYLVEVWVCSLVDFGPWSDDIDLIHKRAKELRDLLAKDQQCQDFLKAHGIDPFGLLDVANEQGLYNVDALQPNNLKVTNGEAEGDIQAAISPGRPDGYLTTVNSLGAFFHDTYSWGKFTFDLTVDRGRFQGGKEPAQIFTLLHELAHSTLATDHDQGSAALTRQNDKKIEENCKKTIDALKKMK